MNRHRPRNKRAPWPDTPMAHAFLIALAKWVLTHRDDVDAKVTLPVGVAGAEEVLNVLHALETARLANEGAQP